MVTWDTLFDGEITTAYATSEDANVCRDFSLGADITDGDTLRVTFDGAVSILTPVAIPVTYGTNYYVGNKGLLSGYYGETFEDSGESYCIHQEFMLGVYRPALYTRDAGTYNLKIEKRVSNNNAVNTIDPTALTIGQLIGRVILGQRNNKLQHTS